MFKMLKRFHPKRAFSTLALAAIAAGLLLSPATAVAAHGEDEGSLDAVREATDQFHNLDRAKHAGYLSLLSCFDSPGVGGMGQHYVKGRLLDTKVTPEKPEALVYEVDGNKLTLVAVEYIIPQSVWTKKAAPRLFGRSFFRNDTLGLWALHAWVWRHNPLGTFANYNPNVKLCPGH
jgi:hypothetical protein